MASEDLEYTAYVLWTTFITLFGVFSLPFFLEFDRHGHYKLLLYGKICIMIIQKNVF